MINLDSILKIRGIILLTKVPIVKAMIFPVVRYGCESWTIKKAEHWRMMLLNCGVGEDSWESLGQQGDQTVNHKGNQFWLFTGRTDAEAEAPILWPPAVTPWKRPWCWERLKVGEEGNDRGGGGWMASPIRQTWAPASSTSWRWAGRPGVLQSVRSQSRAWLSGWAGLTVKPDCERWWASFTIGIM